MRLLIASNFFRPFAHGGYEQWCAEVVDELSRRGHELCVLTSRPRRGGPPAPQAGVCVRRLLHLEVEGGMLRTSMRMLWRRRQCEQENLEHVRRTIKDFRPEMALIWGMWNVPRAVPALVEELLPGHVAYYFCDYWPALPSAYLQQWQAPAGQLRLRAPKQWLARPFIHRLKDEQRPRLQIQHAMCVSQAVRDQLASKGIAMTDARVVHGGTSLADSAMATRAQPNGHAPALKLLYAGRVTVEKGVHAAIDSMALLDSDSMHVTLDIVGRGDAGYVRTLMDQVERHGLSGRVTFRDGIAHDQMPSLLVQYDALVFPSVWDAFPRIVLEAMAAGLVVIGTLTGGTGEVLSEGDTGLTFGYGDAHGLAKQIRRLHADPSLRNRLREEGRMRVAEHFGFRRMVDEIESVLRTIASDAK